jgi:hypothetical protein
LLSTAVAVMAGRRSEFSALNMRSVLNNAAIS